MFLDLAPEIVLHILQFCSPRDLSLLSRVHTSLQDAVESALYRHICLRHSDSIDTTRGTLVAMTEDGSLLDTLTTNARKARMVKALYFQIELYYYIDYKIVRPILVKLAEALEKMPNLVDLRVVNGMIRDPSKGRISQVIRDGYFQLHTLCLEQDNDFEGIIASQPNLQLLGIHHYSSVGTRVKEYLQRLAPHHPKMPKFFILQVDFMTKTVALNMFPSSHRPGEAVEVCREIGKWLLANVEYTMDAYLSFSLFGISEENITLLTELVEATARKVQTDYTFLSCSCLRIVIHDTTIQKPWRFPQFIRSLALFENVKTLYFYFPDVNEVVLGALSTDLRSCLLKDLGRAWPKIQDVELHNRTQTSVLMDRPSNWGPNEIISSDIEDDVFEDLDDGSDSDGVIR